MRTVDLTPFRHLYPFRSRYMDINGFRYHYLDEGSGAPIVMVHGNPTWSFYYRSLVQALSPDFRTIVPDHIGCGLSEKPDAGRYGYRLRNRVDDLEVFICPSTGQAAPAAGGVGSGSSYIYHLGLTEASASTEPLLEDSPDNHAGAGKNVLYVGGHVKWIPAD